MSGTWNAEPEKGQRLAELGDVILLDENEWVVIKVEWEGGGCGHGPGDVYPNGWSVTVKKLIPNSAIPYDVEEEERQFYQTGCFQSSYMIENLEFSRKKFKKIVDFVRIK